VRYGALRRGIRQAWSPAGANHPSHFSPPFPVNIDVILYLHPFNFVMMDDFETRIKQKLKAQDDNGQYRSLKLLPGNLLDFTSNDYLGLARSPELGRLIQARFNSIGITQNGSGGSRLLSGNTLLAEQTEQFLGSVFRAQSVLLFNSGYQANLGVLSSLPGRGDTLLYDELVHASIKDGARLSLASRYSFRHNDLNDLETKLKKSRGIPYIAVESVYSMDGDECPLQELVGLSYKYNAVVILDEAHSTGIYGEAGGGLAVSLGLETQIPLRILTFGKAMGIHGACTACSKDIRDYLINFSRPFIYTTALPAHSLVAIASSFAYLHRNEALRSKLKQKIELFRHHYKQETGSGSPIQPILVQGNENARAAAVQLQSKGFDVRPVLSPTVREGTERLRICIHAFNEDSGIASLAAALNQLHSD
jgi:8-amino-7-oxononanoate synthase